MDTKRVSVHILMLMCFAPPALAQLAPATDSVLELGPHVQYVTPSEAVVSWWTREECPSVLEYGLAGPGAKYSPSIQLDGDHRGKLENRREDPQPKKRHALRIPGLRWNEVYGYRITTRQGEGERSTPVFELDTALNYGTRPLPTGAALSDNRGHVERMRGLAKEILSHSGVDKGYCLVWGLVDGILLYELVAQSGLTAIGLDSDADRVARVRRDLYRVGVYGTRITVQQVTDMDHLPYPDNFANLIVSEQAWAQGKCPGRAAAMYRILRPRGSSAVRCSPIERPEHAGAVEQWPKADAIEFQKRQTAAAVFHLSAKPVPKGLGSWTHQYGAVGNTADSHDELGGATSTDQLRVQWLGQPGADFGMDRNPRMPAPLAAHGRLFHQGMNRTQNILLGSAVRKNTSYTDFWGGEAWYDKKTGAGTEKVCSDVLFAYDLETGRPVWTWREGLVINPTIAIANERVYFVESRSQQAKDAPSRRLNDVGFWSDQRLVCLDVRTGAPVWKAPLDTVDGIVTFFLCCRPEALLVVSSADGRYHLYRFDPDSGHPLWHVEHKWPSDNHGGHMQHPVVLSDRVFLEPCGYDLAIGRLLTSKRSGREGCATYCGTTHALVHRGQSRCITLWDFTTGRITSWRNLRPSCWLSTVVGEGMVLSPEGGGGCSCGNWLEISLAFSPKAGRAPVTVSTSLDEATGRRQ
jgi:hypothetical protein